MATIPYSPLPEGQGSVLAALVGVMDHLPPAGAGRSFIFSAPTASPVLRDESMAQHDDAPAEHVKDDGQIEEAR